MRKLVVSILTSLDGHAAGPGGNFMLMPLDKVLQRLPPRAPPYRRHLAARPHDIRGFRSYWPIIADDPAQDAIEREISRLTTAARKVIVSDPLAPDDLSGWGETEVVSRADAHEAVRRIKAQDGADILVFGSMPVWNDLLVAGLVDELHVMVGNGVLGDGVPAFTGPVPGPLALKEVRRLAESDHVLLVYSTGTGEQRGHVDPSRKG